MAIRRYNTTNTSTDRQSIECKIKIPTISELAAIVAMDERIIQMAGM